MECPLCYNNLIFDIQGPQNRKLNLCNNCMLVFSEKENLPEWNYEKAFYLNNSDDKKDKRHKTLLSNVIEIALPLLHGKRRGLDFGCGPVPVIPGLIKKEGFNCEFYDPIFFSEPPAGKFDFIFAVNCIEHFFRPADEFHKIENLISHGGILIIMTQLWNNAQKVQNWPYAADPTRVLFYNKTTLKFMNQIFGFSSVLIDDNHGVYILQKE